MYLMFIKDNSIVKIPDKSCSTKDKFRKVSKCNRK